MVDDISDTSKNKLTIAERKEIVKKVGKELGLQTELEVASQLVSAVEKINDDDNLKGLAKQFFDIAVKRRDGEFVIFLRPTVSVELADDCTRIRVCIFDFIDDREVPEDCIKDFYGKIKDKFFPSLTFRNRNIDFSMFVPIVSEEYFEQIFRLCLVDALNIMQEIVDAFRIYKKLVNDD